MPQNAGQRGPARLNVSQAARYLDVSRDTIRLWRDRDGRLPVRGTWTLAELDAAAEAKPPKPARRTTKHPPAEVGPSEDPALEHGRPSATGGAIPPPAGGDTTEDAGEAGAGTTKPAQAPAAPAVTRDPMVLNLPRPAGGKASVPPEPEPEGDDRHEDQAEPPAPPPAPPSSAPPSRPRSMFDGWFKSA